MTIEDTKDIRKLLSKQTLVRNLHNRIEIHAETMWSQTNVNEIIARSLNRKQQLINSPLRVKLLLYYLNFVGIKFCVYCV